MSQFIHSVKYVARGLFNLAMNHKKATMVIVGVLAAWILVSLAHAGGPANSLQSTNKSGSIAQIVDNSENIGGVDRQFAPGGFNVTAHTQPLMVPNTGEDVSFRFAVEFVRFISVHSEDNLRRLARGGDYEMHFTPMVNFEKAPLEAWDGKRYIWIVTGDSHPDGFRGVAPYDIEADDDDTNSFQLIAKAALLAIENGDNVLWINYQGWKDRVNASGWGIGTHAVHAQVTPGGTQSTVGGGGLGYSKNTAGTEMRPFIRGWSGCVPTEIGPPAGTIPVSDSRSAHIIPDGNQDYTGGK